MMDHTEKTASDSELLERTIDFAGDLQEQVYKLKENVIHVIGNGLSPVRNYLELARAKETTSEERENYIARSIAAVDSLMERARKEFACSD